jgi:hypothetical protein
MRQADVILMGRHGRAGRLYLMVGSMTSKVIGLGFPLVLMVPKDFLITGAHVLVAVDDSPSSRLAVEEALSLGLCCVTLERLTFVPWPGARAAWTRPGAWSRTSVPAAGKNGRTCISRPWPEWGTLRILSYGPPRSVGWT